MDRLFDIVLEYLKNENARLVLLFAVSATVVFVLTKIYSFFWKAKLDQLEYKRRKREDNASKSLIQKATLNDIRRYDETTRRIERKIEHPKGTGILRSPKSVSMLPLSFVVLAAIILILFLLGKFGCPAF